MPVCLIAQPIHEAGTDALRAAGLEVRLASAPDLDTLAAEIAEADAVLIRDALPDWVIDRAPRLKVIANHGTGTDAVAVAHATQRGIPVVYTPEANVQAVAEHAMMLMLATARQASAADVATRRGDWRFKYHHDTYSLSGKTLGVIGYGHTGKWVARMAAGGFGMRVRVWSPSADPAGIEGVEVAPTLRDLLAHADVVSMHRPLRPDTRHTLNSESLAWLPPHGIVVNTSRGGLIDEAALVSALRGKRLAGAGLDVFENEPLAPGHPLTELENVVLTPHMAGSTVEALKETALQCAQGIVAVLAGERPPNLRNPEAWKA
ncbi:D-3-phosphoglycerate dehydrogenase [Bordetella tumbae]|uniref:hydroxyacid dehydrogenase n=1 Tax=Bordetella tumbae TaxID=1649139 RepID=UPI0039EE20BC